LTPERWQQIKTILDEAADCAPEELRPFLARACGGDAELAREVESFLAQEERLEGFIEEPLLPVEAWTAGDATDAVEAGGLEGPAEGRLVGPYRLVRLLGRGGMGAVYLAQRQEEFEQRVALKLVRPALLDRGALSRFRAERQILARLEHPHIARLLDGGTTAEGTPYFVMELIEGQPIDRWCDERRLPVRRRLELFLDVCSALQAAHQSLVIHRDLKPANILVDASGTVKLLDFGIATVLSPEEPPDTPPSPAFQQAMTLRYASPEQLRGGLVGTASDLYSLGVVLYQLLTGRLPNDLESRRGEDLVRAVCEETPLPPSEAARRGGAPRALRRRLAGDLDRIVLQTLEKEPRQRYGSVEQLALDLGRHLDGLPVAAHPGGFVYRAGKLVRRHRLGVAAAAALVLLALAFTAALILQLRATERARDRAEGVSAFLVDLFQAAAPDRPAGDEPTLRELLEEGRRRLEAGLEGEPEVRATLALKLGEVYAKLGDYPEARELLEEAGELLGRIHGGDHPDLATALNDLAAVDYFSGHTARAEQLYRESIAMRRRLGQTGDLIKPMNNLAAILLARGELTEAEEIYRESLERRRAALGERHPNVASSLLALGTTLYAAGDYTAAEPLLAEALDIRREVYGPASPPAAAVLAVQGALEHARGHDAEAERLLTRALEIRCEELGEDHLLTVLTAKDLASLRLDQGEAAAAGRLLTGALETLRRTRPTDDVYTAEVEGLLGAVAAAQGRPEQGRARLAAALEVLERRRGPRALSTRQLRRRLAGLEAGIGAAAEAAQSP
jgi:serine/threonine-protein kinase